MESSPSDNPSQNLSQTEAWFRDILLKILGWSGAVIVVLTGWTLHGTNEFSLAKCSPLFTDDICQRSVALAVSYPLFLFAWLTMVIWVRERCPRHSTVPSKSVVYSYVAAMTIFSLVVLGLILD